MKIALLCGAYPPAHPAHRSGGTLQAVIALVDALGDQHEFHVITRHPGDTAAGPAPGRWQRRGKALVYHARDRDLAPDRMARILGELDPHAYYVNSLLAPRVSITPVMLRGIGAIPRRPIIVAPRGELHPAALLTKRRKKAVFIELARRLPAYRDVLWQAGSEDEAGHIAGAFGRDARIAIARDLTQLGFDARAPARAKQRGQLSLAYLGRITPMKNLDFALQALRRVKGRITYDVYGPVVEASYRARCGLLARQLQGHVEVRFAGEIPHERVPDLLGRHHALLFPTRGESFGHAILEALLAGCVPILSDQTPWRRLATTGAGWDLPLSEDAFVEVIQACVDMDQAELERASLAARARAEVAIRSTAARDENVALFEALREPRRPASPAI